MADAFGPNAFLVSGKVRLDLSELDKQFGTLDSKLRSLASALNTSLGKEFEAVLGGVTAKVAELSSQLEALSARAKGDKGTTAQLKTVEAALAKETELRVKAELERERIKAQGEARAVEHAARSEGRILEIEAKAKAERETLESKYNNLVRTLQEKARLADVASAQKTEIQKTAAAEAGSRKRIAAAQTEAQQIATLIGRSLRQTRVKRGVADTLAGFGVRDQLAATWSSVVAPSRPPVKAGAPRSAVSAMWNASSRDFFTPGIITDYFEPLALAGRPVPRGNSFEGIASRMQLPFPEVLSNFIVRRSRKSEGFGGILVAAESLKTALKSIESGMPGVVSSLRLMTIATDQMAASEHRAALNAAGLRKSMAMGSIVGSAVGTLRKADILALQSAMHSRIMQGPMGAGLSAALAGVPVMTSPLESGAGQVMTRAGGRYGIATLSQRTGVYGLGIPTTKVGPHVVPGESVAAAQLMGLSRFGALTGAVNEVSRSAKNLKVIFKDIGSTTSLFKDALRDVPGLLTAIASGFNRVRNAAEVASATIRLQSRGVKTGMATALGLGVSPLLGAALQQAVGGTGAYSVGMHLGGLNQLRGAQTSLGPLTLGAHSQLLEARAARQQQISTLGQMQFRWELQKAQLAGSAFGSTTMPEKGEAPLRFRLGAASEWKGKEYARVNVPAASTAAFSNLKPGLDAGAKGFNQLNQAASGFGGTMGGLNSLVGTFFSTMFLVGGLTAPFGAAVKAATAFETKMRDVNTIARLTESEYQVLKKETLELARTTGVSVDAMDAATALYRIYSANIKDAADSQELLKWSLLASKGGLVSVDQAADVLTSVFGAYGREVGSVQHVSDILFDTVRLGKLRFEDLTKNLGSIVGVSANVGMSLESYGAILAASTIKGLAADKTTMALRQTISKLISPTASAKKIFEQYGISLQKSDFEGDKFIDTLIMIDEKLGGNVDALRRVVGNVRSFNLVLGLVKDNGYKMREMLKELNHSSDGVGAAMRAVNEQTKGAGEKWAHFKSILQEFLINAGDKLLPLLMKVVDWLTWMAEQVAKLPSGFTNILTNMLAIGAGAIALRVVVAGLKAVSMAFLEIAASANIAAGSASRATGVFATAGSGRGLLAAMGGGSVVGTFSLVALGIYAIADGLISAYEQAEIFKSAAIDAFESGQKGVRGIINELTALDKTLKDVTATYEQVAPKFRRFLYTGETGEAGGAKVPFMAPAAKETKEFGFAVAQLGGPKNVADLISEAKKKKGPLSFEEYARKFKKRKVGQEEYKQYASVIQQVLGIGGTLADVGEYDLGGPVAGAAVKMRDEVKDYAKSVLLQRMPSLRRKSLKEQKAVFEKHAQELSNIELEIISDIEKSQQAKLLDLSEGLSPEVIKGIAQIGGLEGKTLGDVRKRLKGAESTRVMIGRKWESIPGKGTPEEVATADFFKSMTDERFAFIQKQTGKFADLNSQIVLTGVAFGQATKKVQEHNLVVTNLGGKYEDLKTELETSGEDILPVGERIAKVKELMQEYEKFNQKHADEYTELQEKLKTLEKQKVNQSYEDFSHNLSRRKKDLDISVSEEYKAQKEYHDKYAEELKKDPVLLRRVRDEVQNLRTDMRNEAYNLEVAAVQEKIQLGELEVSEGIKQLEAILAAREKAKTITVQQAIALRKIISNLKKQELKEAIDIEKAKLDAIAKGHAAKAAAIKHDLDVALKRGASEQDILKLMKALKAEKLAEVDTLEKKANTKAEKKGRTKEDQAAIDQEFKNKRTEVESEIKAGLESAADTLRDRAAKTSQNKISMWGLEINMIQRQMDMLKKQQEFGVDTSKKQIDMLKKQLAIRKAIIEEERKIAIASAQTKDDAALIEAEAENKKTEAILDTKDAIDELKKAQEEEQEQSKSGINTIMTLDEFFASMQDKNFGKSYFAGTGSKGFRGRDFKSAVRQATLETEYRGKMKRPFGKEVQLEGPDVTEAGKELRKAAGEEVVEPVVAKKTSLGARVLYDLMQRKGAEMAGAAGGGAFGAGAMPPAWSLAEQQRNAGIRSMLEQAVTESVLGREQQKKKPAVKKETPQANVQQTVTIRVMIDGNIQMLDSGQLKPATVASLCGDLGIPALLGGMLPIGNT